MPAAEMVLTGEGAERVVIGLPLVQSGKTVRFLDILPGCRLSDRCAAYLHAPRAPISGGVSSWRGAIRRRPLTLGIDAYGYRDLQLRFMRPPMRERAREKTNPWADCKCVDRARTLAPAERGIWVAHGVLWLEIGFRPKGDRVAHAFLGWRCETVLDKDVSTFGTRICIHVGNSTVRGHILLALRNAGCPRRCIAAQVYFPCASGRFNVETEPAFVCSALSEASLRSHRIF